MSKKRERAAKNREKTKNTERIEKSEIKFLTSSHSVFVPSGITLLQIL